MQPVLPTLIQPPANPPPAVHSPSAARSSPDSPFHKSLAAARSRQSESVKPEESQPREADPSNAPPPDPVCVPQSATDSNVVSDQTPTPDAKTPQHQTDEAESTQASAADNETPQTSQAVPPAMIPVPSIPSSGDDAAFHAPPANAEAAPPPQPNESAASGPASASQAVHVQLPLEAIHVAVAGEVSAIPEPAGKTADSQSMPPASRVSPTSGTSTPDTTDAPTPTFASIQAPPELIAAQQPQVPPEFQNAAPRSASFDQSETAQGSKKPDSGPHRETVQPHSNALVNGQPQVVDESDRAPSAGEGQQPARQRSVPNRTVIQADSQMAPATVRAMQVDAAVRLENATGQLPSADAAPRNTAQAIPLSHTAGTLTSVHVNPGSAAATAGVSNLPQAFTADEAQFSSRVVRGLSAMVNQRGGVMNMRLDPPELGQLRVQMTIARGIVSADFQAGTPQAHALLEKNMVALRNALEGQGLTVERLSVHVAPSGAGQQTMRDDANGGDNSNQWHRHHDHNAGGGESRGRRDEPSGRSPQQFGRADFAALFQDLQDVTDSAAAA